jgi:hypothetical protein
MAKDFQEGSLGWILSKLNSIAEAQADGVCNLCGEPILSFKDAISKTEYDISATCQNCQDGIFGDDPFTEDENE